MVDVTLVIVLSPSTHVPADPRSAARRHRRGDIFDVQRSSDVAIFDGADWHVPDIGTQVFGYIHIRNVPTAAALRMRHVLCSNTGEEAERTKIDPATGEEEIVTYGDPWRARRFRIPRSVIPAGAKAKLLAEREITVNWTAFRSRIRKKIIVTRLDPNSDDESNAVSDDDLI